MRVAVAGKGKGLLARVREEFLTASIFSKYDETAYKMSELLIPLGKVTSKKIYIAQGCFFRVFEGHSFLYGQNDEEICRLPGG